MRVHTYTAGAEAAVTHPDVKPEVRLRELLMVEADERVYRVGDEVEVDLDLTIVELFAADPGHVIVHPCREIAAAVSYAGQDRIVNAHPATRVRDVRAKAIAEFGLDAGSSADLVLRLPGSTADLVLSNPIGTYVPKGTCSVTLDMVHLVRPQG
jgi:hypothetical protein